MLDLKFVVANAEAVKQNCRNRNAPPDVLEDVDLVVALEAERKGLLQGVEDVRRRQNEVAQATGRERDAWEAGRARSRRASGSNRRSPRRRSGSAASRPS